MGIFEASSPVLTLHGLRFAGSPMVWVKGCRWRWPGRLDPPTGRTGAGTSVSCHGLIVVSLHMHVLMSEAKIQRGKDGRVAQSLGLAWHIRAVVPSSCLEGFTCRTWPRASIPLTNTITIHNSLPCIAPASKRPMGRPPLPLKERGCHTYQPLRNCDPPRWATAPDESRPTSHTG